MTTEWSIKRASVYTCEMPYEWLWMHGWSQTWSMNAPDRRMLHPSWPQLRFGVCHGFFFQATDGWLLKRCQLDCAEVDGETGKGQAREQSGRGPTSQEASLQNESFCLRPKMNLWCLIRANEWAQFSSCRPLSYPTPPYVAAPAPFLPCFFPFFP
ncbi:hypothetical protein BKA80DRAFT_126167 [Phyllosticta citrichinensis]